MLAIAEYVRIVEDQPRDWNTRQHARRSLRPRRPDRQGGRAVHARSPITCAPRGSIPKAAALYKKILKIKPDDESVQLQLGEISAKQGLLADAKAYFMTRGRPAHARAATRPAPTRSSSGSARSIRPTIDARALAARTLAQNGDADRARRCSTARCTPTCSRRGAPTRRSSALREAVRLNPDDTEGRVELAQRGRRRGDLDGARGRISIARPPATIRRCCWR